MLQAGYQYNRYVAFEGRYWIGVGGIDQTPNNASGDFDAWGLYVKPMYPVTNTLDLYALLGYADSTIDYDSALDWETDGFSWGLGAQYAITDRILLFADYVSMASQDTIDYNGGSVNADTDLYTINIGVTYKF
jgi:opacity protein-like surface antigen